MINQIEPWIDDEELIQLRRVIDSTFVTEHDLTLEFEEKIKSLTGSPYAVSVTNGTAALFCALKALGIGEGDEVIVPNMTFIASSNAVLMAGATPIFCEIKSDTFCIDMDYAEALVSPKTKALMPVHLYGQSADMDAVLAFADRHGLKIIEDAAQGVGVTYKNKHVGTFGAAGILSFYGNKTITCGEGGVILTDDSEVRDECYKLKNHGRLTKGTFLHDSIGYNFSFTEMQAAIGISQLNKLPRIIENKKAIWNYYHKRLASLNKLFIPVELNPLSSPVHWFTSFLTPHKESLKNFLKKRKVQTRDFFYPLHRQPCYGSLKIPPDYFPISNKIYEQGLSLPSSFNLTRENQDMVVESILEFHHSL